MSGGRVRASRWITHSQRHSFVPHTFTLAIFAAALLVAVPAAAQTAPRELRVRMGELGRELADGGEGTKLIRFFPRHSPLTNESTPDPDGAAGPVLRRVLRPDSVRAHLEGTPVMCAFEGALGPVTPPWRYAGGGWFTSRGRYGSAWSLKWVRERGLWVVRQITEEYHISRPLLGRPVGEISRDTPAYSWLPEERRYAGATEWYPDA